MNDNDKLAVDINTAEIEELTQIPGVGPELAKRIVEARPYQSLDDLRRVSGISTVFIEGISPYVALQPEPMDVEEEQIDEGVKEPSASEEPEVQGETLEEALEAPPLEQVEEVPDDLTEIPESDAQGETLEGVLVSDAEEVAPEETAPVPEEGEIPEEEPVIAQMDAPPAEEKAPPEPAPRPPVFSRAQTIGILLGGMFITLVLSLLLGLGILAGLNSGRLQYASPARVNELAARAESLRTAIDTNAQDITSLRTRVDNLDALSGRVSEVEQDVEQIGSDMDAVSMQFEELNRQANELANQVDTLQEQSDRFSNFLSGLMELMNGLFGSEEGSK